MTQASLWQGDQHSVEFSELCNALYERELRVLADAKISNVIGIQGRLKSLPHYIKRTAHQMIQVQTPMTLDSQNASWSAKQSARLPLAGQEAESVWQWYEKTTPTPGLVVPVAYSDHIVLDSIDRLDKENHRFRTNVHGWFDQANVVKNQPRQCRLLKPTKKVMMAACAGHCWENNEKRRPIMPSLRELLLSCTINWRNFKQPLPITALL